MKKPRRVKEPVSENHVKELVQDWYDDRDAWHYAPIQTGMGVHGIHDRVGCIPVTITSNMVGKTVGVLISVESKRPGRRGEKDRGMSKHQVDHMDAINAAGGVSICCDGKADLAGLDLLLEVLTTVPPPRFSGYMAPHEG